MSEYTPTEADVRGIYVEYYMRHTGRLHSHTEAEFDAWLARVRRGAAREALDGVILYAETRAQVATTGRGTDEWSTTAANIAVLRATHYPEGEGGKP